MSREPEAIKRCVIEILKHSKQPMAKENIIRRVVHDLANGEIEEALIESEIERMADRMIILITPAGKYRLNE